MINSTFKRLGGSSLLLLACAAGAQDVASSAISIDEIIVTARRRSESLQDVPQTVNAVTSEAVDKLNIQRFDEIQAVIPGLTLAAGNTGYTTAATIRGAAFQVESSATPTVEFYLNDANIGSNFLFQSLYDIGQIEVLRGPQGTLRGRASPSGSITATTHRPDLSEFGGYVNLTSTNQSALNGHAAVNLPIVNDVLALRFAGIYDENDYDQVKSIHNENNPSSRTKSGRVSLRYQPADAFEANIMYQYLRRDLRSFDQYESFFLADPTATPPANTAVYPTIDASDRRGITDGMRESSQKQDSLVAQLDYRFAGQKLSYVGSYFRQDIPALSPQDVGNVALNFEFFQDLLTHSEDKVHELRLSSEERIFGVFDYTVGAYYSKRPSLSEIINGSLVGIQTGQFTVLPISIPGIAPGGVLPTPIHRESETTEKSFFGNITYHLGERTELSAGLRRIDWKATSEFSLNGVLVPTATEDDHNTPTVYNVSVSYRLTDDFLVYANHCKSWRSGPLAIGVFRTPTPRLSQFTDLKPETSKSYEVGFKAELFDKRLRMNASVFHQDFSDYIYRGPLVSYVSLTNNNPNQPSPSTFNFVSNVDAKVDGGELELGLRATERFSLGANFSYAKGKIKDGAVACNDFNGDGVPDTSPTTPTVAQIRAAAGGEEVAACRVNDRLAFAPN